MRIRQTAWLLVLLVGIAPARQGGLQPAPQTALQSEDEKCVIQGMVTKLPMGDPLKGAEVVLTPEGRFRSLYRVDTDAAGQFSLSDIDPGKYQIWVRKDGYESPGRQCSSETIQDGDDLTIVSGQKLLGLKFQLLAPAVVTGTAFDPSGDPFTHLRPQHHRLLCRFPQSISRRDQRHRQNLPRQRRLRNQR